MLVLSLLLAFVGTTSQTAFERCGETHLTVRNNTSEWVEVVMFNDYKSIAPGEFTVFFTTEDVSVNRVTRRKLNQVYHTSITSEFSIEQRECTYEWASL